MDTATAGRDPGADFATLILAAVADGVTVQDATGRLLYANPAAAALIGYASSAELLAAPVPDLLARFDLLDAAGQPLDARALPNWQVLQGAPEATATVGYRIRATGEVRWAIVRARPLQITAGAPPAVVNLFHDITAQVEAEAVARAAEARARFLAEAGAVLAGSLDYATTLGQVAHLAVPTVADWCTVHIADATGHLHQLAVAHRDPAKVQWAQEIQRRYPPDPAAPTGPYAVFRTCQTEFYPEIPATMLQAAARDADHWAIIQAIGFSAVITVPLVAHERALGVLTLVAAESGRRYTAADRRLAEDLGRRAALAIENARLYQAAQVQQEEYRVTLASIGDGVVATDAAGRVRFLNPVAEALTGWPAAAAAGEALTTIFPIIHETTRAPVENPVTRVLREGQVVGLANHTLLIARDGTERPIADSGAPIRDRVGAIQGTVLVFRDATEERRQVAALEASEAQFRLLADAVPALLWLGAADGRRTYFNGAWLTYTGRTLAEEQGFGWLDGVHPDDRARMLQRYQDAIAAQTPVEIEYRLRRADGTYGWMLSRAAPVPRPPSPEAVFIGTTLDITDRKQTEARQAFFAQVGAQLAAILDYPQAIATITPLGIPLFADLAILDLWTPEGTLERVGVAAADPETEAILRELQRRYPPDAGQAGARHVLATGRPRLIPTVPADRLAAAGQDAAHRALLQQLGMQAYAILPLRARGRVLGTWTLGRGPAGRGYSEADLPVLEDLAGRAALALDNARLYGEAQAAIATRDQFLVLAAHELKTPLTAVLGGLQLIARRQARAGGFAPQDARTWTVVQAQAARLNRLILALLDLSRIQMGQLTLEYQPFDLAALAQRLVEEMQPSAEQHTLRYAGPVAGAWIDGDELRVEQALHNLLANAVKYSPAGGEVTLAITVDPGEICATVRDPGIGIPADAQAQLFTRFYRAPNAEQARIPGVGVGLYVVQEIMSLHGGRVAVESTEGVGSAFTLCFPARAPGPPPAAPDGFPAPPEAA